MGRFDEIDRLKALLNSYKPLSNDTMDSLKKAYAVEMTYNSNAIEGNTLTQIETKVVVEDGIAIGGKTVREHLEAVNHYEALEYIESLVDSAKIGEDTIKHIHYLVMKGIDKDYAGKYRLNNVVISGSEHVPPSYMQVPSEMEKLLAWFGEAKEKLHPVELAVMFHFKFVYIHPFRDGNGRTARLLMNLILMQYGYPPVVIKVTDRVRYIEALEKASITGEIEDLLQLIIEYVEQSFKKYFLLLE